jgi:hypothetical protein
MVFGKSFKQKKFEQELKKAFAPKPKERQTKHKLKAAFKSDLNGGLLGFTYVGPIQMGTSALRMDVIYDTGSDWLAVEGSTCTTCEGDKYDGSKGTKMTTGLLTRDYGSARLTGYAYKDRVCIGNTYCVNDF